MGGGRGRAGRGGRRTHQHRVEVGGGERVVVAGKGLAAGELGQVRRPLRLEVDARGHLSGQVAVHLPDLPAP